MALTDQPPLRTLLTPSLFSLVVHARIPYSKTDTIDFDQLGPYIFGSGIFRQTVSSAAWPALVALSALDLNSQASDLTTFLPDPSDDSYPEQCLGLQLLLDQCPRALFRGADKRWTGAHFDVLSQRLARTWHGLAAELRPDARERWSGATLDYVVATRFFFVCPFVHSEGAADQETALAFSEATRCMVEEATGLTDPHRAERAALLGDVHAFARVRRAGPPRGSRVDCASWTWWMCMLMDVHKPIVDRFGRYPSKNRMAGRENTSDEEIWLAEEGRTSGSGLPDGVDARGPLEPLGMGERG